MIRVGDGSKNCKTIDLFDNPKAMYEFFETIPFSTDLTVRSGSENEQWCDSTAPLLGNEVYIEFIKRRTEHYLSLIIYADNLFHIECSYLWHELKDKKGPKYRYTAKQLFVNDAEEITLEDVDDLMLIISLCREPF